MTGLKRYLLGVLYGIGILIACVVAGVFYFCLLIFSGVIAFLASLVGSLEYQ